MESQKTNEGYSFEDEEFLGDELMPDITEDSGVIDELDDGIGSEPEMPDIEIPSVPHYREAAPTEESEHKAKQKPEKGSITGSGIFWKATSGIFGILGFSWKWFPVKLVLIVLAIAYFMGFGNLKKYWGGIAQESARTVQVIKETPSASPPKDKTEQKRKVNKQLAALVEKITQRKLKGNADADLHHRPPRDRKNHDRQGTRK